MRISLISSYITKKFLIKFLQVICGFSLLIFFINLIDVLDKIKEAPNLVYTAASMAFLQIPNFLNDVVSSLVLISAIITFFLLSSKSEITIIRISGFSLWKMLQPIAISAFVLGIFWITVFGPISIVMMKKFNTLENKYINQETREFVAPQNGIWLKQPNMQKHGEELIIQAKKVYKENLEMADVAIWFFNKNSEFYKKIDAKKMVMVKDSWIMNDVVLNEGEIINQKLDSVTIKTNLDADFIMQKVVNNFENEKLFSLYQLPELINDLSSSGFASTKFRIYFHSLISKPLLFVAMSLIACYFGINHIRNNNSILMIFFGIIIGLIFYIVTSLINALGSSRLIPIFASTWLIVIISLAIGTLLIYHKEHL